MGWHGEQIVRLCSHRWFQRSTMAFAIVLNLFNFLASDSALVRWTAVLFIGLCAVAQWRVEASHRRLARILSSLEQRVRDL